MNLSPIISLITRPNHDATTNYLCFWTGKIIDRTTSKVLDLKNNKATKKNLLSYLKKHNPDVVIFNGHGDEKSIAGYNDEILVRVENDENFFKEKIIYARSCRSAKLFGTSCIRHGAKAFIGYKKDFILVFNPNKITKPLLDNIAKYFLEPSNLIILSLLKGKRPEEAFQKSQTEWMKKIKFLLTDKASNEERTLMPFLWRDMNAEVLLN